MSTLSNNLSKALKYLPTLISTPLENNFKSEYFTDFAANTWPFAIGIVISYLLFITIGSKVMQMVEKPFDLTMTLACWNAFLCVFSFIGMLKTVSLSLYNNAVHYCCKYMTSMYINRFLT